MTHVSAPYAGLMACLYLLIFALKAFMGRDGADLVIVLYVLLTFLHSLTMRGLTRPLLPAALFFALLGDICINLTPFREGALFFCATHLLLARLYLKLSPFRARDLPKAVPFFLVSLSFYVSIFPYLDPVLTTLLPVYLLLVSVMAWRACSLGPGPGHTVLMAGSILFYLTDLSVLADMIARMTFFSLLTWTLYPPALFLLSISKAR